MDAQSEAPLATAIERLVDRHPLALIISTGSAGSVVTPAPLLLERVGERTVLHGHLARANPHVGRLWADRRAFVIFLGPHGYVSPSVLTDRRQAPSWNYALAQMDVEITFEERPGAPHRAVSDLTRHMEKGRPKPWNPEEMGERMDVLLPHVVAFRATVLSANGRFKLGQKDRADVYRESLTAFIKAGADDLATAMIDANSGRPAVVDSPHVQS